MSTAVTDPLPFRRVRVPITEESLREFLDDADVTIIRFGKSIEITAPITFPDGIEIDFQGYYLVQGAAHAVSFNALCNAGRHQIFSGFLAGEITGNFGTGVVYPEWWGLEDDNHDIAINAALQCSLLGGSGYGLTVSLAARRYDVSAPLDVSARRNHLRGEGMLRTEIRSTSAWDGRFYNATSFPYNATGNMASMIWMGGEFPANQTFGSRVSGLYVNCYYASVAHWNDKYISGISSRAFVEEGSFIEDVLVSYATGVSIGFPSLAGHGATFALTAVAGVITAVAVLTPGQDYITGAVTLSAAPGTGESLTPVIDEDTGQILSVTVTAGGTGHTTGDTVSAAIDQPATVNGLVIRNVWLTSAGKRESYPMYFTHHANNCVVDCVTIDMRIVKSQSSKYAQAYGYDSVVYSAPAQVLDWPLIGIHAAGKVHIREVHIESCGIGVLIPSTDGINNVTLESVDCLHMMSRGYGQAYYNDYYPIAISAANALLASDYNATIAGTTLLKVDTTAGLVATQPIRLVGVTGDSTYIDGASGADDSIWQVVRVVSATQVVINKAWSGVPTVSGYGYVIPLEPAREFSAAISSATNNAGSVRFTVDTTLGMKAGEFFMVVHSDVPAYNVLHTITTVHSATEVTTNQAWVSSPTSGDVRLKIVSDAYTTASYWDHSCLVLIAREDDAQYLATENRKDLVNCTGLQIYGSCDFVLRDAIFGNEVTGYGKGQFPTNNTAGVAFYSRAAAYINSPRWPYTLSEIYDADDPPANTAPYFLGPVS